MRIWSRWQFCVGNCLSLSLCATLTVADSVRNVIIYQYRIWSSWYLGFVRYTEFASLFLACSMFWCLSLLLLNALPTQAACRYNNNRIQKRYSRFFTISSQRRKLSPTCTLKWPGRNRVVVVVVAFKHTANPSRPSFTFCSVVWLTVGAPL